LLNDKGEVIGITTAGIVVQGETTGFGLSIPISQAIPLLRQVPGFNTSQLGNSTIVLSLDGIRRTVGPDTAFVEAEIQRPLSDLLPRQALGTSLALGQGRAELLRLGWSGGVTAASISLLKYLKNEQIRIISLAETYSQIASNDSTEEIMMNIFDRSSPGNASRALISLSNPKAWNLPDLYDHGYDNSWAGGWVSVLDVERMFPERRPLSILLSKHQKTGGITVNMLLAYCPAKFHSINLKSVYPLLSLWGFERFRIYNLVFLII